MNKRQRNNTWLKNCIGYAIVATSLLFGLVFFLASSEANVVAADTCDVREFIWSEYPQLNPDGSTPFPHIVPLTGVAGSGVDVTVTVPQAARGGDTNRVGSFLEPPEVFIPYLPSASIYRYWPEPGIEDPVMITIDFSQNVRVGNFMYGANRLRSTLNGGANSVSKVTFWDGSGGTGNKVVSGFSPPDSTALITSPAPLTAAINLLDLDFNPGSPYVPSLTDGSYFGVKEGPPAGERNYVILQMDQNIIRSITWELYETNDDGDIVAGDSTSGYIGSFEFYLCTPTAVSIIDFQSSNMPVLPWLATLVALVLVTGLLIMARQRQETVD